MQIMKAVKDFFSIKPKKGAFNIGAVIGGVIGLMVLFLVLAELLPEASTAGDTLNASGAPLGSLFTGGGVIFVIIMAGILMAIVGYFWKMKK